MLRDTRAGNALFLAVGLGLSALAVPATAQAETVLQLNRWLPPAHFVNTRVLEPWAEEIGKATEGRVKVQMTSSSLGPPPRQYDLARDGVADIAWGTHGYTPDRFPAAAAFELPFLGNSAEGISVAHWRTHKKHFEKLDEHAGVELLGLHVQPPGSVVSSKPLKTLADLRGQKLRIVNAATARITEKVGAVAVSAPVTKTYEMLSRGVIDGSFITTDSLISLKLNEHARHQMRVDGGFYNVSFFLVMNRKSWDSLESRDRTAIEALSGEHFARRVGGVWDEEHDKAVDAVRAQGVSLTMIEGEMLEQLRALIGEAETAWIESMAEKGVDGAAALKMIRDVAAAHKRD